MSDPMPEVPVIKRPKVHPQPVTWRAANKVRIPGIGLMRGANILAHLTPSECYALAIRLVDLADQLQAEQINTTQKEES